MAIKYKFNFRAASAELLADAEVGAELLYGVSLKTLDKQAKDAGEELTEKEFNALVRTGRRQARLGLSK